MVLALETMALCYFDKDGDSSHYNFGQQRALSHVVWSVRQSALLWLSLSRYF